MRRPGKTLANPCHTPNHSFYCCFPGGCNIGTVSTSHLGQTLTAAAAASREYSSSKLLTPEVLHVTQETGSESQDTISTQSGTFSEDFVDVEFSTVELTPTHFRSTETLTRSEVYSTRDLYNVEPPRGESATRDLWSTEMRKSSEVFSTKYSREAKSSTAESPSKGLPSAETWRPTGVYSTANSFTSDLLTMKPTPTDVPALDASDMHSIGLITGVFSTLQVSFSEISSTSLSTDTDHGPISIVTHVPLLLASKVVAATVDYATDSYESSIETSYAHEILSSSSKDSGISTETEVFLDPTTVAYQVGNMCMQ